MAADIIWMYRFMLTIHPNYFRKGEKFMKYDNSAKPDPKWTGFAFIFLWCVFILRTDACSAISVDAKELYPDRYIAVERDGYPWDYMTEAEFHLIASFVEVVAGDCDELEKKQLAQVVINRRFSEDYPNRWDEIIWDKEKDGLWWYIPDNISLEDIEVTESTESALFSAILYPSNDNMSILEWEGFEWTTKKKDTSKNNTWTPSIPYFAALWNN